MITAVIGTRQTELPTSVSELSPEQYRHYLMLVMAYYGGTIDKAVFCRRWFGHLAGLGPGGTDILRPEFKARAEEAMTEVANGFFEDEQPIVGCCRNLLPEYGVFTGPKDYLSGLEYGRFTACMSALERAAAFPEQAKECFEDVARELYNIPDEASVPPMLAIHAVALFRAVWEMIQSGPISISGRHVDLSIIFKSSGESRPDDQTGWSGITFEVASSGVFGTVADVERADFWDVLLYLYKCKFEYNYEKSKSKK